MSVNIIQWLGIYPDAIEDAAETAEGAMTEAGCLAADIDGIHSEIAERFRSGELDCSDITNALIAEYFDRAKAAIEEQIKGIDITYYVNCDDSHFYVNGEEYFNGDGIIEELREGIDVVRVEGAEHGNIPAVRMVLEFEDEELLVDLLMGAEDNNGVSLCDTYDIDGYELLEEIDRAERFMDFEASVKLLENGKRVFEVSLWDEQEGVEHVMRADRPEQLQLAEKLSIKTDMAIKEWAGAAFKDTLEENLLRKHLDNRNKQKESGREYDM